MMADTILVSDGRGFREVQGSASLLEIRQGGAPEPLSIVLIPFGELVNELQTKARRATRRANPARSLPRQQPINRR
jgi:hypothetical protein